MLCVPQPLYEILGHFSMLYVPIACVLDIEPLRHAVFPLPIFRHAVCPHASVLDIEPFQHAVRY